MWARSPRQRVKRNGRQRLESFVDEWWVLYAEPNLERSTLAVYRWAWEHHARPRLGSLRLRDVTPLTVARFRAALEADGVGAETIRKTLTLLQSVFQRAVEWQLLEANPVRAARKPPVGRARAVPAIGPAIVEAMRADLRARGRARDARLIMLLAYAGLRPGEALGLEWRHVRERTLLVEQAVSDGQLKGLKNRRRPRAVRLLAPLRDDIDPARTIRSGVRPSRRRPLARDRLAQLAPPRVPAGSGARGPGRREALRPPPRLRVPADRRGPPLDHRDRGATGAQPDGVPGHLRARDGRAGGYGRVLRGPDLGGESSGRQAV